MKQRIAIIATGIGLILMLGCGEGKTEAIGEPGGVGVYKGSINRAGETASAASDKVNSEQQSLTGN